MKYFRKIDYPGLGWTLLHLRDEILGNERLWSVDQRRQHRLAVQRNTESIPLRSADRTNADAQAVENIQKSRLTRFSAHFPETLSFLSGVSSFLCGTLERAMYVRLLPHSVVYPHIDAGSYYAVRDRYHFVLISNGGSPLRAGGEDVVMHAGELWWFDNKAVHESSNPSDEWRIHLIFDIF